VRVTLDWTLDLVFSKDLVQFMPLRPPPTRKADAKTPTDESNVETAQARVA
jgi:hypothetical protein